MLLNVSGVHKAYGPDIVLDGIDFRIDRREKVALVGRNGVGKTTLLKILTDQLEPDQGSVWLSRGAKIGYLRQEHHFESGETVLDQAEKARADQLRIRTRLDELELRLESGASQEELDEYATLHEHYMELEGYSAERDLRTVLQRMGFDESEFDKPAEKLSGGEKTRLALARLLLEQPDLLILDEPTNHLDLQATEWLEGWLRSYPGAVLLVSHDRAFLGNVGDRVLEMRDGRVKTYPGPFDKFLKLRAEEDLRLAEVAKRQDQELAKLDEYVRRFMNSQRTAQARGRLKMMEKLQSTKVEAPKGDKGMKAGFKAAKRSGDVVWEVKDLSFGYTEEFLFTSLSWTVRIGERWGVVGENGSGKSTLIKLILGRLAHQKEEGEASTSRSIHLGANLDVAYFAQDTVDLDPSQSPIDYLVWQFDMTPEAARNLLGRFLLTGDDVFRPVKTLSGGEKNKLVLASLTTLNPNVLVLDEPTNHLDMASREALADVLKDYTGTLVLVSHDRWLLEQVTNHTLDIRRGGAKIYPGSYGEYRARGNRAKPILPSPPDPLSRAGTNIPGRGGAELSPRELSKEIGRLTKLVAELEDAVHAEEEALKELEDKLASLPPNADVMALTMEHAHIQESISGHMAAWEEQAAKLQELQSSRDN